MTLQIYQGYVLCRSRALRLASVPYPLAKEEQYIDTQFRSQRGGGVPDDNIAVTAKR